MRKLVLATRNEHKVKELKELLHGLPFDIKTLNDYPNVPPIVEDGATYVDNAVKKAVIVANNTGELSLADDSGLEVTILDGKPGIHSARFAPDDQSRIKKLLQSLSTISTKDRGAQFVCAAAIAEPHGQVWTVQGTCQGMISPTPLGENGFGYDPIFFFPELKKTFAQLSSQEKAHHGHRGKAVRNARLILNKIHTTSASPILDKDKEIEIPRYASIDIGTNCLRLLIADIDKEQHLKTFLRHSEIVRLGQGMAEKQLSPGGIQRVFQQMEKYMEVLKKHPVVDIFIGATSAVRDATNQEEFVQKFYDKFKLQVKVLGAEEEAQMTFLGASSDIVNGSTFVVDIGGGSTEFIKGNDGKIEKEKSIKLGTVRLTEKYIYHDPVTTAEMEAAIKQIHHELENLEFGELDKTYRLIGTGGTMTTIATMSQHLEQYDSAKVHGYETSLSDIELLAYELVQRTEEKRKELPGLDPKRADVILAGILICQEIMRYFHFGKLTISERDILDGLILMNVPSNN